MSSAESVKFVDLQAQHAAYGEAIDAAMADVVAKGAFILGPQVKDLERTLADYAGVKHGIGVASGTDALFLSLGALGIGPGDEVITVPYTWFATTEVILRVGATPVFVDIRPDTFCIDVEQVEAAITDKTKAIMAVSLYGQMADYVALQAIADKHGISVIEDAAQSFGASQNGQKSCSVTRVSATSFYPTKPLNAYGDGGMIFTNDDDLATRFDQMRQHGQAGRENHVCLGMNSRLATLQAAVVLAKFPGFDKEVAARQRAAAYYSEHLAEVCTVPPTAAGNSHVHAVYTLRHAQRDALVEAIRARGLAAAVYYKSCVHLQPTCAHLGYGPGRFPVAEQAIKEVFSLPMHPYLSDEDLAIVVDTVKAAVGDLG